MKTPRSTIRSPASKGVFDEPARVRRENHNLQLPVSRLATEILTHIFSLSAEDTKDFRWELNWLVPSHVCRRWRAVALAAPSLWSNMTHGTYAGNRWAREFMARARRVDVQFERMRPLKKFEIKYIRAHLAHFAMLYLSYTGCSMAKLSLRQPAPRLRKLVWISTEFDDISNADVPGDLFAGDAPRLRTVKLQGMRFPGAVPAFMHLSSLTIGSNYYPPIPEVLPPTVAHILDLLRSCPSLEFLDVDIENWDGAQIPLGRLEDTAVPIRLERLCHFAFHAAGRVCCAVLQHVDIPPLVDFSVFFKYENEPASAEVLDACVPLWARWAEACQTSLSSQDPDRTLTLAVMVYSRGGLCIATGYDDVVIHTFDFGSPFLFYPIPFGDDDERTPEFAWMDRIFAAAPARTVTELHLDWWPLVVRLKNASAGLDGLARLRRLYFTNEWAVVESVVRQLAVEGALPELDLLEISASYRKPSGDKAVGKQAVLAALDAFKRGRAEMGRPFGLDVSDEDYVVTYRAYLCK